MNDAFVEAHGLRMHYRAWTPVTANGTLVLVHGLGSSARIWDLVAPMLAAQNLRVIALDQRGHGETDQPDSGYDFPTITADLLAFLDCVGVAEPAILVGHSWGASVVLHFAVDHPDRAAGIALVDGGTGSPGERWSWEETESRLRPPDIDGLPWAQFRERVSARNNGALADARVETVTRSLFHVDAEGRISRRFRIPNHMQVVRALWEQRPAELLPRVACPLLILPARQPSDGPEWLASKAANIERVLRLQPSARVRWFEDTVHDVPLQRPEELAAELQAFATEVLGARAAS